jgi:hypothetical protein
MLDAGLSFQFMKKNVILHSFVLDQSVGPDPSDESKNLPCVSPATFAASGTNSGIHESGDQ